MAVVNIPLFKLGTSNKDLYNICELIKKAKDLKNITPDVVIAGGACLVELFKTGSTLSVSWGAQLRSATSVASTRTSSFRFNDNYQKQNYIYIPRFYANALDLYITVFSPRYQDINKKYGLSDNEYRKSINSATSLLDAIAKICNIIMPLCKRKKIDCFHIQTALKIIYIANSSSLNKLLIKTINSTAKLLVNDDALANTIKTDPMITKTISTFTDILTNGITITNEAAIYLSMFMLSLNPDIPEPDILITLNNKKPVSKKKKSPSATPSTKPDSPDSVAPSTKPDSQDSVASSVKQDSQDSVASSVKQDSQDSVASSVKQDSQDSVASSVKQDSQDSVASSVKQDSPDKIINTNGSTNPDNIKNDITEISKTEKPKKLIFKLKM